MRHTPIDSLVQGLSEMFSMPHPEPMSTSTISGQAMGTEGQATLRKTQCEGRS